MVATPWSATRTLIVSTRHAAKASTCSPLCRACRWPFIRVERGSVFGESIVRPWNSGISTRGWSATGSPHPRSLAIGDGAGTRGNFGIAVGDAAAISDVAEVFTGVGCVGAIECDGLLGGDLKGEKEGEGEEGSLVEHGLLDD